MLRIDCVRGLEEKYAALTAASGTDTRLPESRPATLAARDDVLAAEAQDVAAAVATRAAPEHAAALAWQIGGAHGRTGRVGRLRADEPGQATGQRGFAVTALTGAVDTCRRDVHLLLLP